MIWLEVLRLLPPLIKAASELAKGNPDTAASHYQDAEDAAAARAGTAAGAAAYQASRNVNRNR